MPRLSEARLIQLLDTYLLRHLLEGFPVPPRITVFLPLVVDGLATETVVKPIGRAAAPHGTAPCS